MKLSITKKDGSIIDLIRVTKYNFDEVCDFLGFTPELIVNPNYGVDKNGTTNSSYLGITIIENELDENNEVVGETIHNIYLGNYVGIDTDGTLYNGTKEYLSELYSVIHSKRMTFGDALELVKRGRLVTRKGWNGKGMFIFMRPSDEIDSDVVVNKVKSLPKELKSYINNNCKGTKVKFTNYLCMKTSNGSIVNGWLASQTDMLADDWYEFVE